MKPGHLAKFSIWGFLYRLVDAAYSVFLCSFAYYLVITHGCQKNIYRLDQIFSPNSNIWEFTDDTGLYHPFTLSLFDVCGTHSVVCY